LDEGKKGVGGVVPNDGVKNVNRKGKIRVLSIRGAKILLKPKKGKMGWIKRF